MTNGKSILENEQCYLREWQLGDGKYHYELNSDAEVVKYTGDVAFENLEAAEKFNQAYDQFEKNGCGRWLLFLKSNDEFVGWCGLKYHPNLDAYDLGYRLLQKHWGKGLATSTSIQVLEWAMSHLPPKRIFAKAAVENIASIRVLEKLGFTKDRVEEDHGMQVIVFERP